MDKNSSFFTGGLLLSASTFEPLVSWALTGFRGAMPASVPLTVASLLVAGVHGLYNLAAARAASKSAALAPTIPTIPTVPVAPVAQPAAPAAQQ